MMPKSHPSKNNRSTSAHSSNNRNENNVSTRVSAEIQSATFLGPIPHPAILEGYEKIVPGAAERILIMAESSMKHQQQYDNALLEASKKQAARGQIPGFLIGLSAISASVFSAFIAVPCFGRNTGRNDCCITCCGFCCRKNGQKRGNIVIESVVYLLSFPRFLPV